MATAGAVIGNDFILYVSRSNQFKPVMCGTGVTMSADRQLIDVTCKDNGGARQVKLGGKSVTFTHTGFIHFDTDTTEFGYADLLDIWNDGEEVLVRQSTNVNGDTYMQCTCLVTNVSNDGGVNAGVTYTITFESTGTITIGTET
jgi:predicted secreted protein